MDNAPFPALFFKREGKRMGLMTFRRLRGRELKEVDRVEETETAGNSQNGAGDDGNGEPGTNGAGAGENAAGGHADGTGGTDNADHSNADDGKGQNEKPNSAPEKLTGEEYEEIMRNKTNVMKELTKHGIEFSERDQKADELRVVLKAALKEKGVLPDGIE